MLVVYPAIFEPYEEGGGYAVSFPDLPGCTTCGDSLAEAVLAAEDAAGGWLIGELEEGAKLPKASDFAALEGTISLVAVDLEAYANKYGKVAVRKSLTIPAWLNTFAEENNISCSAVLQEALTKMAVRR